MFSLADRHFRRSPVRLASFALTLAFVTGVAVPIAGAQTIVVNPHLVSFSPSPDHNAVASDGQAIVSQYSLAFYPVGGSQSLTALNLGKPAPSADGYITVDFSTMLASAPAPGQQLEARVAAVGPGGSAESAPSGAFTFDCTTAVSPTAMSEPSQGGSGSVGVTAYNGCGWQAASGASWITITSGAAGTANGTVAFTVAPNPTTASRLGTITVGAHTVTVTEAASVSTNLAPSVQLTSPSSGASFTAPAIVTVSASASDSDGTVTDVSFYANGNLVASFAAAPYTMNWSSVAAGSYTLTAVATDNSGARTTSAAVSITIAAAGDLPPSVQVTNPADNSTMTAPVSVTLTAAASDADGTVARVDFYVNNSLVGSATAAPYSTRWNIGSSGTYTVTAVASDNGGASTTAAPVTVTVRKKNGKR